VPTLHNQRRRHARPLAKTSGESQKRHRVPRNLAPESVLDILRILATVLEVLESDRQKWWTSPEKREQRHRLEEEADQRKLSALHKINNETNDRIEAMSSKLGLFVKWSLGMSGGIWELREGHKVEGAGEKL